MMPLTMRSMIEICLSAWSAEARAAGSPET